MSQVRLADVAWQPCYRIVPSRLPPVGLFDRVASADELATVYAIESLTNDRLRNETGDLALVPPDERMVGPGATPVMAAFTHPNPNGSRFSDGTFGVFYAGRSLTTAIRETVYHRERFLADSSQRPATIKMRVYQINLAGRLRDLRGESREQSRLLAPDDYQASQRYGCSARNAGALGLIYPSVRDWDNGECAAVFRTTVLSSATQTRHLGYVWDGQRITDILSLSHSGIKPHP